MTNDFIRYIVSPFGGSLLLLLFFVTTEHWYSGGVRAAVGALVILISIYTFFGVYMGMS